jgi:nucleotide-binding universal stress UspA family protein
MSGLVVGYDGSDHAKAALRTAVDLGKRLGVGVVVAFGFEANPVGGEALDYWAALREHGQGLLADAIEETKATGVDVETVVVEEAPAKALSELARERQAEMIVVGSAGERPLVGLILGSVPQKLMHLAHVPVLVVRAG